MTRVLKWSALFSVCVLFLALTVSPAGANGAPVKIFLNYLPQFSNFGPTAATGVANVSIGEAWIELTADGMPELSDERYEAWIINAETDEMVSLGRFNADSEGHIEYSAELDELPIAEYRYLVITVEPVPDPDPDPDDRWTIAGIFPDARIQILTGTPTPTPLPGVTPSPGAPVTLPVTGDENPGTWMLIGVVCGACLTLAALRLSQAHSRWWKLRVPVDSDDTAAKVGRKGRQDR